jgi:hypothetical protein
MDARSDQEIETLIGRLSCQDKDRLLSSLLRDVFGDVDDRGEIVLVPERQPDQVDVRSLVTVLRQELWPELCPDEDGFDEDEEAHAEDDSPLGHPTGFGESLGVALDAGELRWPRSG